MHLVLGEVLVDVQQVLLTAAGVHHQVHLIVSHLQDRARVRAHIEKLQPIISPGARNNPESRVVMAMQSKGSERAELCTRDLSPKYRTLASVGYSLSALKFCGPLLGIHGPSYRDKFCIHPAHTTLISY